MPQRRNIWCVRLGAGILLAAGVISTASGQALPDCGKSSAALLAAARAGDYEKAEADFSDPTKQALPTARFDAAVSQLVGKLGQWQSIGEGAVQPRDRGSVVKTPLGFEHGVLIAQVGCDESGLVSSLLFLPSPPQPQSHFAYMLPPYADAKRFQEIATTVGPLKLGATLTMPEGAGPFAGVVLVHGSGPHDRDETHGPNKTFADLAAGLASRGIAVLRYDKRTFAHPEVGAKPDFNLDDEVTDDAVAAVEILRAMSGIDPARVFVLGHSLGAQMAPRIALHDPKVAGLVLLAAPATPLDAMLVRQFRYLADLDGQRDEQEKKKLADVEAGIVQLHHLLAGEPVTGPLLLDLPAPYLRHLAGVDAVADAKKAGKPVLVLQGERDYQISAATDFARWKAAFGSDPRTRLILYPGLSHLFRPAGDPPSPADYQKAAPVDARVVEDIGRWIGSTAISPAAAAGN